MLLNDGGQQKADSSSHVESIGAAGRRLYDWFRLKGYVAFDLPKTVTGLGGFLLLGLATTHVFVATSEAGLPTYFKVYSVGLITGCLAAAAGMWFRRRPRVPRLSWAVGDLLALSFVVIYLVTRFISLRDLGTVTGRWDFAPGTFALALAGAFVAVHMSVLLRINVAYPDRQGWQD